MEEDAGFAQCAVCGYTDHYLDAAEVVERCCLCDTQWGTAPPPNTPTPPTAINLTASTGEIDLGEGSFLLHNPAFFDQAASDQIVQQLIQGIGWEQHSDVLDDGTQAIMPRLIAYQATDATNPKMVYTYPNLDRPLVPVPFHPVVARLAEEIQRELGVEFNSVHLNYYRDGTDHISWHTDEDIPLYGANPVICSLSFGTPRDFLLRTNDKTRLYQLTLAHGSMLVMKGTTQTHFQHSVRKRRETNGARINLTFRRVVL